MTAAALALGIAAASFWSAAEKDTAESPTAKPERTKKNWKLKAESWKLKIESWKLKIDRWIWGKGCKGEKGEKDVKGRKGVKDERSNGVMK